jgi:hypothetical protein
MREARLFATILTLAALTGLSARQGAAADPFQLGVEQQQFMDSNPGSFSGSYGYPAPQAVPTTPRLSAGATRQQSQQPRQTPTIQAGVQKQAVLPKGFMGAWRVMGNRTTVDAQPQYQNGIGQIFQQRTQNVWNIGGNAGNYTLSTDQGVTTQLYVQKVVGNQAFIRYQHPISKTMAQEAIVLQLGDGGMTFEGLERISIVKEGEPQPRAKVTYQLMGQRQ